MIYLKSKSAEDTVGYTVNFDDELPLGFVLDSGEVTIEGSGNTESPVILEVLDVLTSNDVSPSPDTSDVLFSLEQGTEKTWYLLKVRASFTKGGKTRNATKYAKVHVRSIA